MGRRQQRLAIAPGVVLAYERNVDTSTQLRRAGIEVITIAGVRARSRPRRSPLHVLPDREGRAMTPATPRVQPPSSGGRVSVRVVVALGGNALLRRGEWPTRGAAPQRHRLVKALAEFAGSHEPW